MRPKVALVPFGDRYYPREWLDRVIQPSRQLVAAMDCDLVVTEPVIVFGDVAAAQAVVKAAQADLYIALLASWLEVENLVATLRPVFHQPVLLWSHVPFLDGGRRTSLGAFVGAGVARETLEEMDVRHKFIYGMPDDPDVGRQIADYIRVAYARRRLSESRIGLFGYTGMGMYTGTFDHVSLRAKIGPETHQLDQYLIIRRMDEVTDAAVAPVVERLKRDFALGPGVTDAELEKAARMTLALEALADEHKLDAVNVKCHYELSEVYGFTPCLPLSLISEKLTATCEGDMMAATTQLMLHHLTDKQTVYGDIHQVLEDRLTFACCGFSAVGMCDPKRCRISKWASDFEGILNSSPYPTGERVTLARLASKGGCYKMHITTGVTAEPQPWGEVNCPPLPDTDVVLEDDPRWFAQNIASNHYAMVFGDVKQQLLDLCALLDIRPVVA
ncbi:MAG: hypothetical protein ACYC5O_07065 [Anaerolineae bacterium]